MNAPQTAMDQILKYKAAKADRENYSKARDDNLSIVENAHNTAEYSPARYNNHPKQTNFSGS